MSNRMLVPMMLLAGSVVVGLLASIERADIPPIEVPSESLDFGTVLVHNDLRREIPFVNLLNEPISVRQLEASCRCAGLSPASFDIPAGGRTEVVVRVDLSPSTNAMRGGRNWTPTEWPFSVTMVAHLQGDERMSWVFQGEVESPLVFSGPELMLPPGTVVSLAGARTVGPRDDDDHSLRIRCVQPVMDMEVACASSVASARLMATAAEGDSESMLVIDPHGFVEPGQYSFAAVVSAVTQEKQQVAVSIPVKMYVVDDIDVLPTTVHLGYVPLGSSVAGDVTVRSRLERPFTIGEIEYDDELKVNVAGTRVPSSRVMRVEVRSGGKGYQEHRVRMRIHYSESDLSTTCEFHVVYVSETPNA